MTATRAPAAVLIARLLALAACCLSMAAPVRAQETAQVSMPAAVSFQVSDVGATSAGSPAPTTVEFSNAILLLGRAVQISVKADSNLSGPDGSSMPASNISWTTSNPTSGVGVDGVLSASAYNTVFQGQVDATSGRVNVSWTLSAPGTPLLAGTYQVTVRWKVEAVFP